MPKGEGEHLGHEEAENEQTRRVAQRPRSCRRPRPGLKVARPPLYKVILLNDDYTPREFVVKVLEAVFRMGAEKAYAVMMTAHRKGACVIAVYARDVAETKATKAKEERPSSADALFQGSIRCSSAAVPSATAAADRAC